MDEDYDSEAYADYIMAHSDHTIGNGEMLIAAMEDQYLLEEFLDSLE